MAGKAKATAPEYLFRVALVNEDGSRTAYEDTHYRNQAFALQAIARFEKEDKADGCFRADAYVIERRSSADSDDWDIFVQRPKAKTNTYTMTVRLPEQMYADLSVKAAARGMSINEATKMLISRWLYE